MPAPLHLLTCVYIETSCCSQECAQPWIEREGRKERQTLRAHQEEDYDDPTLPTQVMRSGWMYARRKQGDDPDESERSGKWLIWLSADTIDRP